jgi:hypothetical protein
VPTEPDNDLQNLLEQLTGQRSPMQRSEVPPPVVTRVAIPPQSQRPQAARVAIRQQAKVVRPVPARTAPPPIPAQSRQQSATFESASPFSAPATASSVAVSVHPKELGVNLPKMRLPSIRMPSVNLQRATAKGSRIAWIRSPQSLRHTMIGRMILDPPKALESSPR